MLATLHLIIFHIYFLVKERKWPQIQAMPELLEMVSAR